MRGMHSAVAILAFIVALTTGAPTNAEADALLEIRTLSNRADLISGGDALVEVALPAGTDPSTVRVAVDGHDVTRSFAVRGDGRFYGRIDGLSMGLNRITASLPDGSGAYLDIANHPRGGPVFAGEQVEPWTCTTEAAGLGPALDAQCNAEPVFTFYYKHAATGQFEVYDPDSPPPSGVVATTTTDHGVTVPYVVRQEVGAMDRGIYAVAVLFDPAQDWQPWAPQAAWNHKLYQGFGGGCYFQHNQGPAPAGSASSPPTPTVLDDARLSRGFMVSASSLNTYGHNCNDVVSAEAFMMTKEHVAETYGNIRYTMTEGGSGGSVLQTLMADNYPGLSDGLQPFLDGFPDMWIVAGFDLPDCELLDTYFDGAGMSWTPEQRAAVEGKASALTCSALASQAGADGVFGAWWNPAGNCADADVVYDQQTNPDGVRCTLTDYMVSIFGRRPDGRANRFLDNVGVQYGLEALAAGQISAAQFVDLNTRVGGLDIDGQVVPERMVADAPALVAGYEVGYSDGLHLDRVPIINYLTFVNADIHQSYVPRVLQARLVAANGHADNQVIMNDGFDAANSPARSFTLLDEWLTHIEADPSSDPLEVKVVRHRPERAAAEECRGPDSQPLEQSVCDQAFPWFRNARFVAGMPWEREVLKCQLQPLDRAAYGVEFTDEQWAQLQAAFPDGVCDWSKPGVGERANEPWPTFADGPGGRPLGAAPVSVPFGPDREVCLQAPEAAVADRADARAVHRRAVDCVVYVRISVGVAADLYGPRMAVTRGQMASFVVNTLRAAGAEFPAGGSDEPTFVDVAGNVHAHNINRLARAGVISGTGRGRFEPDAPMTRAQMASFMVAAARLAGVDLAPAGDHFADVRGVHADNINTGYAAGLFTGTTAPQDGAARSGLFSPTRDVLRDQMATFLVNLLQLAFTDAG